MKLSGMWSALDISGFKISELIDFVIANSLLQGLILVWMPVFLLNTEISWLSPRNAFERYLARFGFVLIEILALSFMSYKNVEITAMKCFNMESPSLIVLIMSALMFGKIKTGIDHVGAGIREIQNRLNHIVNKEKKQLQKSKKVYCDKAVSTDPPMSSIHKTKSSEPSTAKDTTSLARTYSEKLCNLRLMPRYNPAAVSDRDSVSESYESLFSQGTSETSGTLEESETRSDWKESKDRIDECMSNAVFVGTNLADTLVPIDKSKPGNFIANIFMKRRAKMIGNKHNRLRRAKLKSEPSKAL